MPQQADPLRHNQLVQVARLYYLRSMTHQQIAGKLGISRVKVTRLLQQAVAEHIVEFRIADPAADTLELQERLEKVFGLKQALVAPSGDTAQQTLDTLGRSAARWLGERLRDNLVVGVGWGRTLNAMAPHLAPAGHKGMVVVSLTGGLAANARQPNPYDTATAVASRIGAEPRYLLLPAVVDGEPTRDLLMAQASVRAVTGLWTRADIVLMSIGLLAPDTGVFYSLPDPSAGVAAAERAGGAGDLLARPFDSAGRFLSTDISRRTIAVEPEQLKRVPLVAGVAGGVVKAEAIAGALRTGLLSVLITDEKAARKVLQGAS